MSLIVQDSLPHANYADVSVDVDGKGRPLVSFAADAHGGLARMWFCLRIAQQSRVLRGSGPFTLLLKHLETMLGGTDPTKVIPVVRYDGKPWERLAPGKPAPTDDGRMGAWWTLETPPTHVDVALCYPYGQEELNLLARDTSGAYQADIIGVSQGGRPLLRLANDYGAQDNDRPGVYFIARQHSGETPASWVLDGALRRLAELGDRAPLTWCVPLAHIDGVEDGDYGKSNFPHDFYEAWSEPAKRHEVMVMQRDARQWATRCAPNLMIDFHAGWLCDDAGIYAVHAAADELDKPASEMTRRITNALKDQLGAHAAEVFAHEASADESSNTPFAFFNQQLGVAALTLECPYALCGTTVMTHKDYQAAGAALADAVADALNA